jgi:alkyl hydroperoxide reductase subunit AhpC
MHVRSLVPDLEGQAVMPDGTFGDVRLRDAALWTVVFFYPADFTFVCPTEIRAFSASNDDFRKAGARILGVSIDSVHSHAAWIERDFGGGLPFPLVGDVTREWTGAFDVLEPEAGVALRGTFLVDPGGTLRMAHVTDLDVGRNVDEVYRELEAFKSGGLCPAGWRPGQANLEPPVRGAGEGARH